MNPTSGMNKVNWTKLEKVEDLNQLNEASRSKLCLLFKYSTRCGSSSVALDRLEREWDQTEMSEVQPYFLDLITFRELSNMIADHYQVRHESPQVILIQNGRSVFDTSHFLINYQKIREVATGINIRSEN